VTFDVAELHDLSVGGTYSVQSSGALSFAEADSNELVGSVPFESNKLDLDVDGDEAAAVRVEFHAKRTRVTSSCTGTRLSITQQALSNCANLARIGQQAAQSGAAAKLTEFFKSSTSTTRSTVATVFSRVASECGTTNSGVSTYYCSDPYGVCTGSVLAYTVPSASVMVS
jgi:deuterolysin